MSSRGGDASSAEQDHGEIIEAAAASPAKSPEVIMVEDVGTTHAARENGDSLVLDIAKGVAAGAVATFVLDRVDWFLYGLEPEASRHRTWQVRPEHKDPAHVIASRVGRAVGAGPVAQGHPAGLAVHYAIGIAPAAVYGAMRGRVPGIDAGRGLGFGFAMFVLEDEVVNPALGVAAPPQRYPWQPHARGLISHLVYGLVADWVLHALAPKARARAGA
jgi:hypothetical protein